MLYSLRTMSCIFGRYGLIAFEDQNIKGMTKNHNLAKSIHDMAWNMLVTLASYKAASAGSMVVSRSKKYV